MTCEQGFRHKGVILTADHLEGTRERSLVTLPGAYHQVVNEGPNVATAVNLALDRGLELEPKHGVAIQTQTWHTIALWYFRRGSANYTEAAKKLLAEYDFVRPFQLHDDPKQQDVLTTWIEYLAYACAVYYRCTRLVKKHQPGYDAAWKTLADSKVLTPSETKENICDFKFASQLDLGEAMALKAVKLDAAKGSIESIKRRGNLISDFYDAVRNYRIAQTDTVKSNVKLRWILEQIPLVEAELKEPGAAQSGSHTGRSSKRKRNRGDEVTEVGPSKRLRKTNCDGVTRQSTSHPADDLQDKPLSLAWTANRSKTRSRRLFCGLGRREQAP
ncbi:hypothetical protein GE09DRAFT_1232253 [Coniochaeta sp. 2T2.1]|nr:hypothetical protein GE09DRAFT_1232253 [Coniochaeta sp. 2T2.1]